MNRWAEVTLYVAVALVLVATAFTLSPLADRPTGSIVVDRGEPPAGESVTPYSSLSEPAQRVVDDVIREARATPPNHQKHTPPSTYDDYAALEALPTTLYVEKGGEIYHVRTLPAGGNGGLFEGIAHDLLLAVAGLLGGGTLFLVNSRRRIESSLVFPIASLAVVFGVNAARAPALSVLSGYFQISLATSVAVPVLAGVAVRQRDLRAGGLAVLTVLIAFGVLALGENASVLGPVVGLFLLAVPGTAFGWWLGNRPDRTGDTADGDAGHVS